MRIAIDFDGVIVTYDGWKGKRIFGEPIQGAREALQHLHDKGHILFINTTRLEVDLIADYLKEKQIPFDFINHNPDNCTQMLHPAKMIADIYIDDRGLCFQGNWSKEFLDKIENFKPWWRK